MRQWCKLLVLTVGVLCLGGRSELQAQGSSAQAMGPSAPCYICAEPGVCVDVGGQGIWGYSTCRGLMDGYCAVSGICFSIGETIRTTEQELSMETGERFDAVPVAPFVWMKVACEARATVVLATRTDALVLDTPGETITLAVR